MRKFCVGWEWGLETNHFHRVGHVHVNPDDMRRFKEVVEQMGSDEKAGTGALSICTTLK